MKSDLELWQITHKWLKNSGNNISKKYLKEELTAHPDYPALLSVADFLDHGDFSYKAVQSDATNINKFNYPLLAHIKQPGQEYLQIINNSNDWSKNNEIKKYWSGIVLYAELGSKWINSQNSRYLKAELLAKIILSILCVLNILLIFYIGKTASLFLFGLLSQIGFIISIILLRTELGYESQIVKQVCGSISNGGCDKVLKSKYANGFFGLRPADASLVYFFSQYCIYVFMAPNGIYLNTIIFLSLIGSFVAVWSIYTQAIIIKQYCILCLILAMTLLAQFFIGLYINQFSVLNIIYPESDFFIGLLIYTHLYAVGIAILFLIKNLITINNSNKLKAVELKSWKADIDLFQAQLLSQPQINSYEWESDFIIGKSEAPVLITVTCNPYCVPCAEAHKKLHYLLEKFEGKLKLKLRFVFDIKNENDKRFIAIKSILQRAHEASNNEEIKVMLLDWFELMDIDKWNKKWPSNLNTDVKELMQLHSKWVENNNITFTPTIFLNKNKFPTKYNLNDLEIILPGYLEYLNNNKM